MDASQPTSELWVEIRLKQNECLFYESYLRKLHLKLKRMEQELKVKYEIIYLLETKVREERESMHENILKFGDLGGYAIKRKLEDLRKFFQDSNDARLTKEEEVVKLKREMQQINMAIEKIEGKRDNAETASLELLNSCTNLEKAEVLGPADLLTLYTIREDFPELNLKFSFHDFIIFSLEDRKSIFEELQIGTEHKYGPEPWESYVLDKGQFKIDNNAVKKAPEEY